jgi:hypothetical protein
VIGEGERERGNDGIKDWVTHGCDLTLTADMTTEEGGSVVRGIIAAFFNQEYERRSRQMSTRVA